MKRLVVLLLATIFALCGESVFAEEKIVTVEKGDTLSQISERETGSFRNYPEIAKINQIDHPYVIYPGQKLKMPEIKKVVSDKKEVTELKSTKTKSKPLGTRENPISYTDDKVGADPFMGTPAEGLRLVNINIPEGKLSFADEGVTYIPYGSTFKMVSGKDKSKWYKGKLSKVMSSVQQIAVRVDGRKIATAYQKKECGNWIGFFKPPAGDTPNIKKGQPPRKVETGGDGEFVYIPPREEEYVIEHEPIVGAWVWQNKLARGWGGYGEYLAWLRKGYDYQYEDGWSPGVGLYGIYSEGDSRTNTYSWTEGGFGPQVGLKYTAADFQWQGKIRLIWEHMSGSNDEGYSMTQDNLKIGGYTEYVQRESDDFYWGLTGEAWYALTKERTSTWSGDSPSRRGTLAINGFGQWKLSEDWQFRGIGGVFYQAWDHMTGIRLQPELRYKETVMFGPWISFFPFGVSSVYDGIASASDLTTYGLFVRIEFGKIIRDYYKDKRMEEIKADDRKWLESLK